MADKIENKEDKVDESAASDTLIPGSQGFDDPKSKFDVIVKAIGALAAAKDTSTLKYFNDMIAASMHKDAPTVGNAGPNAATIEPHPSAAVKEAMKEDLEKIFSEAKDLNTDDFKKKATTLFEVAVDARVKILEAEMEAAFEKALEEANTEITTELEGKLETFLDYVAEEWMKENQVAIESSLRNEIASDFIEGLRQLFLESNFSVPEEQVDLVDELAAKVEELEARLSEAITENANLQTKVEDNNRADVVRTVSEGLTLVEATKLKELAETINEEDMEVFKNKVQTLKESQFVKKPTNKTSVRKTLNENDGVDDVNDTAVVSENKVVDPEMKNYVTALDAALGKVS